MYAKINILNICRWCRKVEAYFGKGHQNSATPMQQPDLRMALPFKSLPALCLACNRHTKTQGTTETEHCGSILQKQLGG